MSLFDSQNIVHIAALLQLSGYFFRDQIVMRGLLIAGSCIYVLYYLLAPAFPLWGGIFWSLAFTAVNLGMIAVLVEDRRIGRISDEDSRLFGMFPGLSPGEFRRLRRMAADMEPETPLTITREGRQVDHLYVLLEGNAVVRKGSEAIVVNAPVFIGEVAFLLGRSASATVELSPGARALRWDSRALKQLALRSPSLRIAVTEALNRDMAQKVAASSVAR